MKLLILLILLNLHLVWNQEHTRTILKFGQDAGSYINMGTVNLTEMEEGFSVCSWVRRMRNHDDRQYWVSYVGSNHDTGEILISDSSRSWILGRSTSYKLPTLTLGTWNHMCHTFSFSTGTKRVFYNGEQIGQDSTVSDRTRRLDRTGTLMFGNYHWSSGGGRIHDSLYFGGELYDTNFFSTELSADQIKQLYKQGRCSDFSKMFEDNTVLSWEDILSHKRTGNVTEVQFECENNGPTEEATEEATEETTEEATEEGTEESTEDSGIWDFLRSKEFYNLLISEEMISRFELLEEFLGHRIDDALIEHLVKHHSDSGLTLSLS